MRRLAALARASARGARAKSAGGAGGALSQRGAASEMLVLWPMGYPWVSVDDLVNKELSGWSSALALEGPLCSSYGIGAVVNRKSLGGSRRAAFP